MASYIWTCNECNAHGVSLHSVSKFGGGSYRRPGRNYSASICRWCVAELMSYLEDSPRSSSQLVMMYNVGRVQYNAERITKQRAELGDFEYGKMEANDYFADYKRITALMKERLATETEEYLAGFHSFNPAK
jgi:hypothetical protein